VFEIQGPTAFFKNITKELVMMMQPRIQESLKKNRFNKSLMRSAIILKIVHCTSQLDDVRNQEKQSIIHEF